MSERSKLLFIKTIPNIYIYSYGYTYSYEAKETINFKSLRLMTYILGQPIEPSMINRLPFFLPFSTGTDSCLGNSTFHQ